MTNVADWLRPIDSLRCCGGGSPLGGANGRRTHWRRINRVSVHARLRSGDRG
ncbi:hypothetical protein RB10821 [Rhodopirellula baltica SH 1]|uniref:Uncharacterized protein n=1 Tax=Rhodopirellula baltica (strain DSM 10527 / NCIMB 13988 / SH1) TaxID=243090 RepID=Q7UK71_RHOBA|nr:hypothetical protein RB10821 [Rhodopirellula baltica SH 1]